MRHFRLLEDVFIEGAWLTIGSFDGVHRGHQEIVKQLTAGAHQQGAPAVVLTFYPHPIAVLRGANGPFYLTSPEERAKMLGELGVDIVITLPFTRELAATPAREFIAELRQHIKFHSLWVGYDFTLGKGREGNVTMLQQFGDEFGYDLKVLRPVIAGEEPISSTRIRSALASGDVTHTAEWLGRSYSVFGQVITGEGRGRSIGIPTANLDIWPEKILPAFGVYACRATVGNQTFKAATNLGVRPTFKGNTAPSVEAHLLDFSGDLYGQVIQLEFITRLRGEQKFTNIQALIEQIHRDIADTSTIVRL